MGEERKREGETAESFLAQFLPELVELLSKFESIELEDVELYAERLALEFLPVAPAVAPAPAPPKPLELLMEGFEEPVMTYPGRVLEVKLGATRSEGGSRGRVVVIGGETCPPFYLFESPPPHRPVITMDVFDTKVPLPKAYKAHIKDVMHDPAEWAKRHVEKFGADMVTVHLISTDPLGEDRSPREAAKTIEEVLQAVDVPIVVGGAGDPHKDAEVFKYIAEMAAGERLMFSSVTLDMAEAGTLEPAAKAIAEGGHVVLAFTPIDLNLARELNRKLYEFVPRDSIVMDLTTAALGYGIEYSYTVMERARLAALMGDKELQHPMSAAPSNSWAAREAWMKEEELGPEWGPRELRGPLWETLTGLILLLAGVDLFMVGHPATARTLKEFIDVLMSRGKAKGADIENWVSASLG
ncbi:CO dehydrogenase/acetyl-CoA synthase subunit delta [Candidatus Bathyarchaeota archaeon]|nr:MAG: CO dehydrogenase/acetyl-CoA synthase subunit delta [Candidatus Bathyarchaeota archaeon]